jgi:hypothetical protein
VLFVNRRLLLVLLLLLASPMAADSSEEPIATWTAWEDADADVRHGVFKVADPACAYTTMANPRAMLGVLPHLQQVTVHSSRDGFQDVTLEERFFPVGVVESRYHRTVNGSDRLEWKLVEGQQAKHDGWWQVERDGTVNFENAIQAKSFLHRALLRGIQVRAMEGIAESVKKHCAI